MKMYDTKRLDWIESQGNGDKWIVRHSVTGRGFRVHNTTNNGFRSLREAIDVAMEYDKSHARMGK